MSPKDAQPLFERAVGMDPSNLLLRKQLAYLYLSQKSYDPALQQFLAADSLWPSDSTKMEIAYLYLSMKRQPDAERTFRSLRGSKYEHLRERASDELDALPSLTPVTWWNRIYADPYYDTRWETSFYSANFQRGYYLTEDKVLSGYGFLSVSGDARSSGGLAPSVFSDNAATVGLGVKLTPFTGFQLSVQQGLSYDLIDRASRSKTRGDFRAVVVYGNGIYAPYTKHPEVKFPFAPYADFYSSFGYYSRYADGIGYLQGHAGLRVLEVSRTVVDLYGKGGYVFDTEPLYYNNLAEWGGGIRVMPNINWGLYLVGEIQRGYYIPVPGSAPSYDRYYNSARLMLIFDKMF